MLKKMMVALAMLLMGGLLLSRVSFAQDPLVVGPDIYKLVFENERVRVMEVTFNPGDKIGSHSHPDHLAYILEPGLIRISHPDGTSMDVDGKAGDVLWIKAETHSAENIGSTKMRILVVELKEVPVVVTNDSK